MSDERDNDKKNKSKDNTKERERDRGTQSDKGKTDGNKSDLSIWKTDHGLPDPKVKTAEQRIHEDAKIMSGTKFMEKEAWYPENKENELTREDKLNVLSTLEKRLADSQGRAEMGIRLSNDKSGREVNKRGEELCQFTEKDLMTMESALPQYLEASRQSYQQEVLARPNAHSEVDADMLRSWQDSHKLGGGPTQSGDSLKADANNYKDEMIHAYINTQDVRKQQKKNR